MKERVKIHIGDIFVSSRPSVVETVLGSCVSVCLHDGIHRLGGMNHILLPGRAVLGEFNGASRYGVNAMETLINKMMKIGTRRRDLRAKIFGGAHIMQTINMDASPGLKNVRFVEEFLEIEDIPIISRDTGGINARKILFHTSTGDVFLKTLPVIHFATVNLEERKYRKKVAKEIQKSVEVELFRN